MRKFAFFIQARRFSDGTIAAVPPPTFSIDKSATIRLTYCLRGE
jgi:hypothetical protein